MNEINDFSNLCAGYFIDHKTSIIKIKNCVYFYSIGDVRGNLCATEDAMSTSRENPYNNDWKRRSRFKDSSHIT